MEEKSFETDKAEILDFETLKTIRDLSLILLVVLLALSFKWHRLSQCLFYGAIMFFMSEALLIWPESKVVWIKNPTTKALCGIMLMAYKAIP